MTPNELEEVSPIEKFERNSSCETEQKNSIMNFQVSGSSFDYGCSVAEDDFDG